MKFNFGFTPMIVYPPSRPLEERVVSAQALPPELPPEPQEQVQEKPTGGILIAVGTGVLWLLSVL